MVGTSNGIFPRTMKIIFERRQGPLLIFLFSLSLFVQSAASQAAVPSLDDTSTSATENAGNPSEDDSKYSFEELLEQAQELILEKRPIDARAKLQKALLRNPDDYRPHLLLGQYYLFEVGHFTLAYRYILTAEELFMKKFGRGGDLVDPKQTKQHVMILYLRAEAELNLDKYEESLKTLDRFGKLYWIDWYPGTRAWVLMKLKRIDEAITVAQSGLIQQADPRRTYNILGILLSVKGSRELSLKAFQQAIAAELGLGSSGQVATPLNNAGEVYRELFKDDLAEAAWLRATRMPDGCDHILPSLNLAILYIDELRFFQAERALSDFEACFAQQSERSDTEHRALLALARGRIQLRTGNIGDALKSLESALEREQWFGKIGTNENDVQFAATIAMAQALRAKVAVIKDTVFESIKDELIAKAEIPALLTRSWWLNRQARNQGLKELSDLEDLFIRNTDTMLEYPTIGSAFAGFPEISFKRRIQRMLEKDDRPGARAYYGIYLAENLLAHGEYDDAESLLKDVRAKLRPIDRLASAQALADLLVTQRRKHHFWESSSREEQIEDLRDREELYNLLPSALRYADLSLPVVISFRPQSEQTEKLLKALSRDASRRLEVVDKDLENEVHFELRLLSEAPTADGAQVTLQLVDRRKGTILTSQASFIKNDWSGRAELVNKFIANVFTHKVDPAGEPVPKLELLEGIM